MTVRVINIILFVVLSVFISVTSFAKTYASEQTTQSSKYSTLEKLLNEFGKEYKNNKWKKFMNGKVIVFDKDYGKHNYDDFYTINGITWDISGEMFIDEYNELYLNVKDANFIGGKFSPVISENNILDKYSDVYFKIYKDDNDMPIRIDIAAYDHCSEEHKFKQECFNKISKQFNSNIKLYSDNFIKCNDSNDTYYFVNLEFNDVIFYVIIEHKNRYYYDGESLYIGKLPPVTIFSIFNEAPYEYIKSLYNFRSGNCKLVISK